MTNTFIENPAGALQVSPERTDRYLISVQQYINFQRDGFLVVPQLVSPEEIYELRLHTEDLMQGRLPERLQPQQQGLRPPQLPPWQFLPQVDLPRMLVQ